MSLPGSGPWCMIRANQTPVSGSFTTRHAVQGDGTATVTDAPPPLALSDFVVPVGRTADLLFLAEASTSGSAAAGFYRTTERGGTNSPIEGDDKFGASNDGKITRLRYQRANKLSANQAGYSGNFEDYSLNAGLRIHIQTEDGVSSWLSTNYTDAGSAGGGYTDWKLIPQSARTLIRNIRRDDRFILAFTLPSPATDTSATFTVRHGVQGDGTATVTDPPAALALADFAPPTGHTADLLFLATASANADNSAGFYRTTERGGSDTPLDEDDKFGANNDGKVTRIRYQRGNRLSVNQAFYTGPSFESYSLTEGLRIHLQTEDGVVSWLSTDYTNAGSAGGGYTDWKLIPQSARTLIRNIRRD